MGKRAKEIVNEPISKSERERRVSVKKVRKSGGRIKIERASARERAKEICPNRIKSRSSSNPIILFHTYCTRLIVPMLVFLIINFNSCTTL